MDENEDELGSGASGQGVAHHAGLATSDDRGLLLVESFLQDRRAEHWAGGEPLRADASVSGTIGRFSPREVPEDVWHRATESVNPSM